MCGIAGYTAFNREGFGEEILLAMGDAIRHRGPDAGGIHYNKNIGLCHRRLSILDLSEAGNQPMFSNSGNEVIVFNGEIYNFPELRAQEEARGYVFKSHTDTEVILALYLRYGEDFVLHLNGMFAMAIWDERKQKLVLARDRLGKKPLYYHVRDGEITFASEIKSLLKVPGLERKIREDAVYDFFTYQYIPDPKTIFSDIYKLEPAHIMVVDASGIRSSAYWDVDFSTQVTKESDACESLLETIDRSVSSRMISDVPLGAFLSGGIDSSLVVSHMARHSSESVKTCTIGFDDKKYDEVDFARIVANKYSTEHYEFTVSENVQDNLLDISRFFDEPFADASFIPTYFVSGLARQKVTVALAGDGGDENFAGYTKYYIDKVENRFRQASPSAFRSRVAPVLGRRIENASFPPLKKASSLLKTIAREPDYGFFISNAFFREHVWESLVHPEFAQKLGDYHPFEVTKKYYRSAPAEDHLSRILYTDIKTWLPGDILVKVDRMSMAHSLETRAPLLDYRLVELAAQLPADMKLKGKTKKYILKKAYESELPADILYRKKMGFSVPLANWLRSELRAIAESYLFKPDAGINNFFRKDRLQQLWVEHMTGKADYAQELWSILVFEMWWGHYMQGLDN